MSHDTFLCAQASGDIYYLKWIRDRLVLVHHENPNMDYIHTLDNYIQYFQRRKEIPQWLNWILQKYKI